MKPVPERYGDVGKCINCQRRYKTPCTKSETNWCKLMWNGPCKATIKRLEPTV